MKVYRIEKVKYNDFPPKGSLFAAGRWNTKGMWVVYTSDSIALAKLETLANSGMLPENRFLWVINIKDEAPLIDIALDDLPSNWNASPYPAILAAKVKTIMASKKFVGAIVPSVQSPRERNILLFPDFPEFNKYVKEMEQIDEDFDHRLK